MALKQGSITKSELIDIYGFSRTTFSYLFNQKYYDQFIALGYEKNKSILPPIVVQKFIELWGLPDDPFDLNEFMQRTKTPE